MATPRLLSDKVPSKFLLMTFIDGQSASEAIKEGQGVDDIFEKLGETTGEIHNVRVENFGNLLKPEGLSWEDLQMEKIENNLKNVKERIDFDLFNKVENLIEKTKFILKEDSKGPPVLITHDIYLDNFIIENETKRAVLIDYGIALGGRPLFDLAKFFIWTLNEYPKQRDNFLNVYKNFVEIPKDFTLKMTFYITRECLGMMDFFTRLKSEEGFSQAVSVLNNLVNNKGSITKLINLN